MTIAKQGQDVSTILKNWKENAEGVDVGATLSSTDAAELASSGPQKIGDVLESIMNDAGLFPTFSFYTVYDTKMRGHLEPMHFVNDMVALREWRDRLLKGHHFAAAPDDYILIYQGDWDQGSGAQIPSDEPRYIATMREILDGNEPEPNASE
jgi:hypothetical protein